MTWLTERFGLTVPVVSAPMAGTSGSALAAAVSQAGALGCLGVGSTTPAGWVGAQADRVRATGRPFGIGLLAWTLADRPDLLDAVLEARPALVSVSYGPYARHVERLRGAGIVVATQAGTLQEAREAEQAGVDLLVARGSEGGGHGRDAVATLPLLQQVLDVVQVPVLAAGGIATARGVAAVLAAGAAGAWVGTAFLACPEAQTGETARRLLLQAGAEATAYGRVFDVGLRQDWPPAYGGRHLRNAFFDQWQGREDALAVDEQAAVELQQAQRAQDPDRAVVYAGQAVGLVASARPAAEVVADLGRGVQLLREAARALP